MEANGSTNPKQLSGESQSIFTEGISLTLSRWTALQLAVENQWGGRNSRQIADQLVFDIFNWFTRTKEPLYIDDLENMLEESMNSLNTMAEDGSIEEVAEKIMILYEECLEGDYESVVKLRETQPAAHPSGRQVVIDDDEDDDEDDDDNDDNSMGTDGPSSMAVDVPRSQSNNSAGMARGEPKSNAVAESEDGWTVVSSRRNKGKRN